MPAPQHAQPRTARGARTRAALVRGAREVFERDGLVDARIADIAAAAGVATGSFYSYFATKEDALAAVLDDVTDEMLHPQVRETPTPTPARWPRSRRPTAPTSWPTGATPSSWR